jgi:hypothetical protein
MGRWGKFVAAASATIAVGCAAGHAQAASWMITYQATWGSPLTANLVLDVADTLNAVGGYDVLTLSGDVDGDTVTGLITNPSQPFPAYSADGLFIFDNVIWTSAPNISGPGLFFAAASGNEYNLFSDNASTYELYRARSGVGYLDHSAGGIGATLVPVRLAANDFGGPGGAVPEPAVWSMMILGFGAVGAMLRHRRAAFVTA